ncbi:MAG: cytidylate kinase-like family protein [Clostridiales bacterium]|nr:cytidylate kinase-like family protein [Clostridiales bacterium]
MNDIIITISRQYGSGGRKIGWLTAEKLGIPCYDGEIIDQAAKISELSPDFIRNREQKLSGSIIFDTTITAKIYNAEAKVIREYAKLGSCVIVGRCADKILEEDFKCLKLFLFADFEIRCQRAVSEYGIAEKGIQKFVKNFDKNRSCFYNIFHGYDWKDLSNYNLCLDTGLFETEKAVEIIEKAYNLMNKEDENN